MRRRSLHDEGGRRLRFARDERSKKDESDEPRSTLCSLSCLVQTVGKSPQQHQTDELHLVVQ